MSNYFQNFYNKSHCLSASLVEGSGDFSHLPQVELALPPGLPSAQSFSAPAAPVPRPAPKVSLCLTREACQEHLKT